MASRLLYFGDDWTMVIICRDAISNEIVAKRSVLNTKDFVLAEKEILEKLSGLGYLTMDGHFCSRTLSDELVLEIFFSKEPIPKEALL